MIDLASDTACCWSPSPVTPLYKLASIRAFTRASQSTSILPASRSIPADLCSTFFYSWRLFFSSLSNKLLITRFWLVLNHQSWQSQFPVSDHMQTHWASKLQASSVNEKKGQMLLNEQQTPTVTNHQKSCCCCDLRTLQAASAYAHHTSHQLSSRSHKRRNTRQQHRPINLVQIVSRGGQQQKILWLCYWPLC